MVRIGNQQLSYHMRGLEVLRLLKVLACMSEAEHAGTVKWHCLTLGAQPFSWISEIHSATIPDPI